MAGGTRAAAPAYAIDLLVQAAVLFSVFWITGMATAATGLTGSFLGLSLFVVFLVHWFYGGVLEAAWNGQTPGKRAMGLRVVTIDGQPIRAWQAMLRNILRCVDALPMAPLLFAASGPEVPLFLVGLAAASLNNRFQRMGDLAAGTMVVVEKGPRLASVLKIRDARVEHIAASIPAGFAVTRTLGLALSLYVERRKVLSRARRLEIGQHLGVRLCRRFNLPPETDHDLLLCALYQKAFLGTTSAESEEGTVPIGPYREMAGVP